MDDGCKRAVLIWHRRAGKEIACWNWLIKEAYAGRKGTYVYFFPTSTLGRRILWDGANKDGKRFLHYIPQEIIDGTPNSVEMKVRLKNGSIIQIMGTDQIINVGINPIGCVFSEFSLQDPATWAFTRPILRENGGWAIFNFTPRGRNHAYDLYLMAKNNPDWFVSKLGIDATDVLDETDMDAERDEGMSEHLIQQEYYCSFDQGVEGAYYAKLLNKAELEKRIGRVPHDPGTTVHTYWDLGIGDETVILWVQFVGQEVHIIDYYHNQNEGLGHYANVIQEKATKYGFTYGSHNVPHDGNHRNNGEYVETRVEILRRLGIDTNVVPMASIADGIESVRSMFPRLWIDSDKCVYLIKCLEAYHKQFNERLNVYSERPVHDWSSHSADAVRYLGIMHARTRTGGMTEAEAERLQNKYAMRY
jgi:hypothetical protein